MWLAFATAQLSVGVAGAAPLHVALGHVSSTGMHMTLPADARLSATDAAPTGTPAPGTSAKRQTAPVSGAARILIGGALLVTAFVMLLRRRGQIRPPSSRRDPPGVDRPETPVQGPPGGTSL